MRSKTWKTLATLAAAVVLALSLGTGAMAQSKDSESGERQLEGTWIVTVTQQNCLTGSPIAPPFHSLLTFARGGTLTETTSNPLFFPAQRGPGHGIWDYAGHRTFSAASLAFITLNGVLVKTQKLTQTIEIGNNPDAFTTTKASIQFFDPTGNLIGAGCAVASGQRFE
jgi:hypothetical protein